MSKPIKRQPGERSIPNWQLGVGGEKFTDIRYQTAEGMAKITINRPEVRNAFRPQTLFELSEAFNLARDNDQVGVIKHSVQVVILMFVVMMATLEMMN